MGALRDQVLVGCEDRFSRFRARELDDDEDQDRIKRRLCGVELNLGCHFEPEDRKVGGEPDVYESVGVVAHALPVSEPIIGVWEVAHARQRWAGRSPGTRAGLLLNF